MSQVAFVKTTDRRDGVKTQIAALESNPVKGKDVPIKPNFNTAAPCPGSTHNDTLVAIVEELWAMAAKSISMGERSYQPTLEVMREKGIIPLLKARDVRIINFDDLPAQEWIEFCPKDSH